jgi:hypothetical protein
MHEFGFMVLKPFYLALTLMRETGKRKEVRRQFFGTPIHL